MDVVAYLKYVCFTFSKQQFYFFVIHGVKNNITPRFEQAAVNFVLGDECFKYEAIVLFPLHSPTALPRGCSLFGHFLLGT